MCQINWVPVHLSVRTIHLPLFPRYLSLSSLNASCIPMPRLAPIKHPLQAAQLPNTFKSHKALQSANSHQAETLRAPIWRPLQWHTENSNGKKVGLDTAWGWMEEATGDLFVKKQQKTWERDPGGWSCVLSQEWGLWVLAGWPKLLRQPETKSTTFASG